MILVRSNRMAYRCETSLFVYRIPYSSLACREVSSIIRDNARSGGGEGTHVLLGGGGLAFLGLESSKEEGLTALKRARNRQGVGRLVLRAAHTQ